MFASEPCNSVIYLPQPFIKAALANRDIQLHLSDPELSRVWTVDGATRHPTVRVEFEQATVIGDLGESLAAANHKHFGRLLRIEPLRPDDPVHPTRVLFIYKATDRDNRRFEQRRVLKRLLGKEPRLPNPLRRSIDQTPLPDPLPDRIRGQGHPPPAQYGPRPGNLSRVDGDKRTQGIEPRS